MRASDSAPHESGPILDLTRVLAFAGRSGEAIDMLRSAVGEMPNDPTLPEQLGRLLLDSGDTAGGLQALGEAVRRGARSAELFRILGNLEQDAGNRNQAADYFRRSLEIDPDQAEISAWLENG